MSFTVTVKNCKCTSKMLIRQHMYCVYNKQQRSLCKKAFNEILRVLQLYTVVAQTC